MEKIPTVDGVGHKASLEAVKLMEVGFDYVTVFNGVLLLRKRK